MSEWDDAVDLWFGEHDVNLSAEARDEDGNGIISEAEFAEGLQRTDLLARLDTADDNLLAEEEFASGLFDVADADDDDLLGEEEDGLLTTIAEFLVPAEDNAERVTDDEVLEDEETFGDEEGIVEDEVDEEPVVFDEVFTQLPIPCGGEGGSCEEVAQRFCERWATASRSPSSMWRAASTLSAARTRSEAGHRTLATRLCLPGATTSVAGRLRLGPLPGPQHQGRRRACSRRR